MPENSQLDRTSFPGQDPSPSTIDPSCTNTSIGPLGGGSPTLAGATTTTLQFLGEFSGGQLGKVNFDVKITRDFSVNVIDSTDGLVVKSLNSSTYPGEDPFNLAGGLGYSFSALTNPSFVFGGLAGGLDGLSEANNDFKFSFLLIDGDLDSVLFFGTIDTREGEAGFAKDLSNSVEVSAIPVPIAAPMLLTGFAMLGFARRCTRQQVSR